MLDQQTTDQKVAYRVACPRLKIEYHEYLMKIVISLEWKTDTILRPIIWALSVSVVAHLSAERCVCRLHIIPIEENISDSNFSSQNASQPKESNLPQQSQQNNDDDPGELTEYQNEDWLLKFTAGIKRDQNWVNWFIFPRVLILKQRVKAHGGN